MTDYTPTTEEIRQLCAHGDTEPPADNVWVNPEKYARFDRWLAQERAQAKAEALMDVGNEFTFTGEQWQGFQTIPSQGYSAKAHLEYLVHNWLRARAEKERNRD